MHYRFRPLFLELTKTDESRLTVLKAVAEFYTNNPQVYIYLALASCALGDCST